MRETLKQGPVSTVYNLPLLILRNDPTIFLQDVDENVLRAKITGDDNNDDSDNAHVKVSPKS